MATMQGVRLPGNSTVEHVTAEVPEPGPGQVLLRMRASSICGSDSHSTFPSGATSAQTSQSESSA